MNLERIAFWSSAIALVFTGLTVVAGGVALVSSRRLSVQKDAELADLRIRLSSQQERTAKAEFSLVELKERVRQRTLTSAQREHLVTALKSSPPGYGFETWCQLGDKESEAYAEQFTAVFFDLGWGRPAKILDREDAPKGVTVRVRDISAVPECVTRFRKAASEAGIEVALEADPEDGRLDANRVYLIVGSKPPLAPPP